MIQKNSLDDARMPSIRLLAMEMFFPQTLCPEVLSLRQLSLEEDDLHAGFSFEDKLEAGFVRTIAKRPAKLGIFKIYFSLAKVLTKMDR